MGKPVIEIGSPDRAESAVSSRKEIKWHIKGTNIIRWQKAERKESLTTGRDVRNRSLILRGIAINLSGINKSDPTTPTPKSDAVF